MTSNEYGQIMAMLERIALALERLAPPITYTFVQEAPPPPPVPHIPNPYWRPQQPTYTPIRFDYHTGDPLPPQRPENIC